MTPILLFLQENYTIETIATQEGEILMNISNSKPHTVTTLTTQELLKMLRSTRSVSDLEKYAETLSTNNSFHTFSEYLCFILREHNITESTLIRNSQIQRTYAYQILNGIKNPGRDKVIALCLAAQMNLEETQRSLTLAGLGQLYPRRHRDSILIFALEHQLSVQQVNELLFEEQEAPLE